MGHDQGVENSPDPSQNNSFGQGRHEDGKPGLFEIAARALNIEMRNISSSEFELRRGPLCTKRRLLAQSRPSTEFCISQKTDLVWRWALLTLASELFRNVGHSIAHANYFD
jgi:hypothetical protein